MRRRDFIAGLGGAVAWTAAARAQQPERMRRIGVLMGYPERDTDLVPTKEWEAASLWRLRASAPAHAGLPPRRRRGEQERGRRV